MELVLHYVLQNHHPAGPAINPKTRYYRHRIYAEILKWHQIGYLKKWLTMPLVTYRSTHGNLFCKFLNADEMSQAGHNEAAPFIKTWSPSLPM